MATSRQQQGFLYRNSLSLVFLALTLATLAGHGWAGWRHEQQQRLQEQRPGITLVRYLGSGDFLSSLFENWESEFLQMGMFVVLTVHLRQWGSSESRPLAPAQEPPEPRVPPAEQPWPARRGGWVRKLYEHSLSGALLLLFAASFAAHAAASWAKHVEEARTRGLVPEGWLEYLLDAEFWFESLQNWQSEFLSVFALCLLSIFLREKDSSQSKAVTARHTDTGT